MVTFVTITIIAFAGYWAGSGLVERMAGLLDDRQVERSLEIAMSALTNLHKQRRQQAEALLSECKVKSLFPDCPEFPWPAKISEQEDLKELGWLSEERFATNYRAKSYVVDFDWGLLKPLFEDVKETHSTRLHLVQILPSFSQSLMNVFAGSIIAAGILGLALTVLLTRRLTTRIKHLISYTRRLAGGALEPLPTVAAGPDEIGLLGTAMHNMARELSAAREKLIYAEKIESWQTVARKVAHEIKNPLTPISLVADELSRQQERIADPQARALVNESARILHEEIAALSRMVKDFSAFARLPDAQLAELEFESVIEDFVQRYRADTRLDIVFETAHQDRTKTLVDKAMIHQVLFNLMQNARQAVLPSKLLLSLKVYRQDQVVCVDIRDNGPGVAQPIVDKLFDAYVTTKSTGTSERGMGLGLAIALKIATNHNGRLYLKHTGPQGSCFTLEIPIGAFV